jgi:hypothetical protein
MEIINFFNCKDHYEARLKEQEYFELLHATLNSIQPMPKPKSKPIKEVKNNENTINNDNTQQYFCEKCDYNCSKKYNWNKHLSTSKHINKIKLNILKQNINVPKNTKCYTCKFCNKGYNARNSLWYHKTKCAFIHKTDPIPIPEKEEPTNKELLTMILQSNLDIKQLLLQLVKNP